MSAKFESCSDKEWSNLASLCLLIKDGASGTIFYYHSYSWKILLWLCSIERKYNMVVSADRAYMKGPRSSFNTPIGRTKCFDIFIIVFSYEFSENRKIFNSLLLIITDVFGMGLLRNKVE